MTIAASQDETQAGTPGSGQKHRFQAEVQKLLHLMIHSLYSNREIFLRELISNASDACDRLRFQAISDPGLMAEDPELRIRIAFDTTARTLSITDNGIGITRDDVIEQLGTIARSGTGEFLAKLKDEQRQDANLIGQFGVGFYSSFIVADRVVVLTRRAGRPATEGVRWESDGQGEFSVDTIERAERGTTVTLHLRSDCSEFADAYRLRALIRKYSDHIAFPVLITTPGVDGAESRDEPANSAKALWTRPRSSITDDEYREFYKHLTHDYQDPLAWSHNQVEGKREYTSLLFVPAQAPWDAWNRAAPRGLKLYVKRVFIMDDAEQFLPLYLRFIRGVVDAADLSLNVSRELLQKDAAVDAMRAALTKRALDLLEKLAQDEPAKYAAVWKQFGRMLKEGPAEDPANGKRIAALLRFTTTRSTDDVPARTLAEYVAAAKPGQKFIWFIAADSLAAARSNPHLEGFRRDDVEVLLLTDPIDEWALGYLAEFGELEFRDARRGSDADATPADTAPPAAPTDGDGRAATLVSRLKASLGADVSDVRTTTRLQESPACLVLADSDVGPQMRRILEASGQAVPDARPILEINADHPLLARLDHAGDRFDDFAHVLLDQARLADGVPLADPGQFVQRLNRILLDTRG